MKREVKRKTTSGMIQEQTGVESKWGSGRGEGNKKFKPGTYSIDRTSTQHISKGGESAKAAAADRWYTIACHCTSGAGTFVENTSNQCQKQTEDDGNDQEDDDEDGDKNEDESVPPGLDEL